MEMMATAPGAATTRAPHRETQAVGAASDASAPPLHSGGPMVHGETLADADGELDESSPEIRRNWSPEVLLALANIYKRVVLENPETSRLGVLQLVYEEFKRGPHCANRSRKAVDDKLYTMKQMYHFIMKMNGNFKPGYRKSVPTWFELTKQERRAVRSLHRVRTPNITLEVFRVLDSVLNPNPTALIESDDGAAQSPTSVMASSAATATPSPANIPDVVDAKRNWSDDVTLELAKAWNAANQQHPELRGAMLSHQVYNAFMATVGFSNRTRKAVDDKMHSMREMYRFVRLYEMQREEGEDKPAWFDLTKKERREMRARYKIRVPNLSREVYDEIDQVMSRSSFEPDEDEHSTPPTVELLGVNPSLSLPPSADQVTEGDASALPLPSALSIPPSSPRQVRNIVAPQTTRAPQVSTMSGSFPLSGSAPNQLSNGIQESMSHTDTALTAASAVATAEPGAKRRRLQPEHDAVSAPEPLDATTAGFLSEQLRLMHEQDREERRRQHAEQMAALREIADLLRQRR